MVITLSPCPKLRQDRLYTLVNFQSAEPSKHDQFSVGSNNHARVAIPIDDEPQKQLF